LLHGQWNRLRASPNGIQGGRGARLVLLEPNEPADRNPTIKPVAPLARVPPQGRIDGLIASLQSETHPETIAALHEMAGPIVLVDREVTGLESSAVLCDHFTGVYDATRSLV